MKKLFSLLLAFSLCLASTAPAFAASENFTVPEGQVVCDNDDYKATVRYSEEELIVTVEYADRYEITTREYESDNIMTQVFNYEGILIDSYSTIMPDSNAPVPYDYYQHTFSNYEYDVDTTSQRHEVWTCRREDDYKTKTRLPGSERLLLLWKQEVDNINDAEKDILVGAGATVVSAVVSSIKAGQIGAAIAMVKGSIEMVNAIEDLYDSYNTADNIFDQL